MRGNLQDLQNRKKFVSISHKRRQCWFVTVTLKILCFRNLLFKAKMSLVNIIWELWSIRGRNLFKWDPNIENNNAPFSSTVVVLSWISQKKTNLCFSSSIPFSWFISEWLFPVFEFQTGHEAKLYDNVTRVQEAVRRIIKEKPKNFIKNLC